MAEWIGVTCLPRLPRANRPSAADPADSRARPSARCVAMALPPPSAGPRRTNRGTPALPRTGATSCTQTRAAPSPDFRFHDLRGRILRSTQLPILDVPVVRGLTCTFVWTFERREIGRAHV